MPSATATSSPSAIPTFDPYAQALTLLYPDTTPFNITIPEIDAFIAYSLKISINYAAQLGASLMLLIVLILVTKPDKRTSPVFLLNSTSLALNFLRNVLACLYFTGPFSEFYAFFAGDFDRVPRSAYANSVAQLVLVLVQVCGVEASLLLQVHIVCVTLRRVYRRIILVVSIVIALLAIGCRFALSVENIRDVLALDNDLGLGRISDAANITLTLSVFWFSAAFLVKLGYAMWQRKKLGLNKFGAMQVLSVMAFQTMTVPGKLHFLFCFYIFHEAMAKSFVFVALFSILEYTTSIPSMESNVLTTVTLFLPLSSIWAASTLPSTPSQGPSARTSHAKKLLSDSEKSTSTFKSGHRSSKGGASVSSAGTRASRDVFATPSRENYPGLLKDLEAQR